MNEKAPDHMPFLWRVSDVAHACSYVQKRGRNEFHKYNYATAADVLDKINDSLHQHGIVSKPSMSIERVEETTNKSGGKEVRVTVRCNLTLVDSLGAASLSTVAFGCGQDSGDKAIMKAQTAAIKYAWMMLFNISTGDDPEADESVDKRMHEADAKPTKRERAKQATAAPVTHSSVPEQCPSCKGPISRFWSTSKKHNGRGYFMCDFAHATVQELLNGGASQATAHGAVPGHFREWAEAWPSDKGGASGPDDD